MRNEIKLGNVIADCDDELKLQRFYGELLGWEESIISASWYSKEITHWIYAVFVLMLKDYLILYRRLHFLSVSERKSHINSFSISNRSMYLSLFAITYRICESLSSLCIDGGIPLSLLQGLPFALITTPAFIFLCFSLYRVMKLCTCFLVNPNFAPISFRVNPYAFNSNISFSYLFMCW